MTGTASTLGVGRIHAAAGDVIYVPRGGAQGRRVVVLSHGYLGTARAFLDDPPSPNAALFARALAARGFLCVAVDVGNTWGNATASARVEEVRTYAAANLGAASDKVVHLAVSMGHLTALAHRRDYPTRVAGIVGIMPACDLNDLRNNNRASCQASVDAAWGVTYPAALPSGADPATNTVALTGVPWSGFYSSGDTVALPSTVTTFAAAMGGTTTVCGNTDHGDAIMPNVSVSAVAAAISPWLNANLTAYTASYGATY